MYGKFCYNIQNQNNTQIISTHKCLWKIKTEKYTKGDFDMTKIQINIFVVTYHANDIYSEHDRFNDYIAAFASGYA